MKTRTRWVLILLGIAVLAGAAVGFPMLGSGIEVETATAERRTLQVTVVEEGRTRVRNRFVVDAPVAGRLARIALDEGDRVSEGMTVARIYPMPENPRQLRVLRARAAAAEARRNEAAARVEEAKAQAEQAAREAARSRELASSSTVSTTTVERNQLAAETAQRQLEAAQATQRAAEAELAAAKAALVGASPEDGEAEPVAVTAPETGRVLRLLERNDRIVQAGTPLIELGDVGALEVVVDVLSEDAVRIADGDPVLIEEWGGDGTLEGRVRLVEPDAFTETSALGVEEQRVNVIVELPEAPEGLGSGFRVEAHIVVWSGDDVLAVPASALFRRGGTWHVFAVRKGEARLQEVRVGRRSSDAAQILEGLEDGETVILFPSDEIEDGAKIAVSAG